ncbi:MAG TPA: hypothetical protein PLC85_04400 [Smithellaceae bacterium]|nr:hypothetical protein [Smithellaceae bacterium]
MLPALKDIGVTKNESSRLHDRKCGEWLRENKPNFDKGAAQTRSQDVTTLRLSDIGVTKNESSRLHDRKCGEWLKENVKQGGTGSNQYKKELRSNDVTLASLNVTKNESSRLQKIAAIPDKIPILGNLQDA